MGPIPRVNHQLSKTWRTDQGGLEDWLPVLFKSNLLFLLMMVSDNRNYAMPRGFHTEPNTIPQIEYSLQLVHKERLILTNRAD
jgi:hypothetical protein